VVLDDPLGDVGLVDGRVFARELSWASILSIIEPSVLYAERSGPIAMLVVS